MDFVENIRVGEERAEAGFSAEIDCPSAVLGTGEVGGIRVAEDTSTQGDELAGMIFQFDRHSKRCGAKVTPSVQRGRISAMNTSNAPI